MYLEHVTYLVCATTRAGKFEGKGIVKDEALIIINVYDVNKYRTIDRSLS